MAISAISNAAAVGTTVAMSAHTTGDLILASVWRTGSTVAPTIPAGWTSARTTTGATSWMGVYYKIAASAAETTGIWTSATAVEVNVYRGAGGVGTGATAGTGTGTTITYPAITLDATNSTSWVYRTACAKAATNITTNTPTGYTARGGVATTASAIRGCDSNAGLASSPSTGTQTVSGSGVWIAISVELKVPIAKMSTLTDDFNTGSVPDPAKWNNLIGGVTVSGGQLVFPASAQALVSQSIYDMTSDSTYFQVNVVGAGPQVIFSSAVGWQWNSSGIAEAYNSGATGVTRTHTAGDWYQIRESGGTVFWDYSATGLSWTNLHSASVGSLTAANVSFSNSSVACQFDNFNIPAVPATNTGAFFAMF